MQARSALFDLYGDHLRHRGGRAPVASIVRILAELDIAAPAVRTAVSRMVRQGWLTPVPTDAGRGYALTDRAVRRLDEAAARIYRQPPDAEWDGSWSLALVSHSPDRTRRERLNRALEYLGYRQLHPDGWLAPRVSAELPALVAAEGLHLSSFRAKLDGDDAALVERLWRPAHLAEDYVRWLAEAEQLVARAGREPSDATAFAVRSMLVHEWRKFLFQDPGLPRALLPLDWPGEKAAAYFDAESARLLPAAAAFVDSCLPGRNS
jgi:phenylacetic acid degradation operon negative regulatory protein